MPAQSHFFVEPGGYTQNPEQSFGPVNNNESNEFRLTSKFTIESSKKAFAICKGVVLVQPQTGSDTKVNLILRPYKQPFPGINIKYFVYRGLQKSDFFTNDLDPKVISNEGSPSYFIDKINKDFKSFHEGRMEADGTTPIPVPDFTAKYIGFDPLIPDATSLSDFFFKESKFVASGNTFDEKDDFELPLMDIGKSLGNFAEGECGIDVVLNYGDYKNNFDNSEFVFDLNYARSAEAKIVLSGTDLQKKLQREQITQFIDIAAFYGLHTSKYAVSVDVAGTKTDKKDQSIYNEVIHNFATKNNWYIYIQSDRTRSYDFYGNYKIGEGSEDLKTGLLEDPVTKEVPMTAVKYGHFGWPILVNTQQQANTITTNNLYLQFPTDNNNNTAFYGQIANVANAQKDTFINADGLRLPPDEEGNYIDFTSTIQLTTPAAEGKNIASLSILLYQGKVNLYTDPQVVPDEEGDPIITYRKANFFDNVFNLIKASPLLSLSGDNSYSKMTSEKLNLINEFYDKKQQGISIVQTLTVNDLIETGNEETPNVARVTYITEAVDVMNNAVSATGSTTSTTYTSASASGAVGNNKTYQLPDPYYYNLKVFTDNTETITGLELKTLDGSTPNKIILGLTKTENESIKTLITEGKKNPRLFLMDLFEDENGLVSPENIRYKKYKIAIVFEDTDGNNKLGETSNPIFVYSLDRRYHYSKGYSKYVKEYKSLNSLEIKLIE